MRHPLEEQVAKAIAHHRLIGASGLVYIALSGGADSVALLRAMLVLGYRERLAALHMNFQLRGEESEADEHFVHQLCQKLDVPLSVEWRETTIYAQERGISIEMAARELRYDWFASLREQADRPEEVCIATAHHADDQLETFLLNLSRGTGIRGLRGMRPLRPEAGIIRPLLDCPRALILDYLSHLGQPWREDRSNADTTYQRNFIRHRLLPLFEELNPAFRTSLQRTMEHLRATEALYEELLATYRERLFRDGQLAFAPLATHPEGQTLLYELLAPYGFSREVLSELYRSITSGQAGARFFSPHYLLHRGSQYLELLPRLAEEAPDVVLSIGQDGAYQLPDRRLLRWEIYPASQWDGSPLPAYEACFDYEALQTETLSLRKRKAGDALYPFGMRGKKLLRRIFIDGKYSQRERLEARLLCREDQPIWLLGKVADRRYRVSPATQRILHFRLTSPSLA